MAYSTNVDTRGTHALFLGAASGGVWRTTFTGNSVPNNPTWTQVSDDLYTQPNGRGQLVASSSAPGAGNIGAIAVDPRNPQIIYVGTGEANFSRDSGSGCGILKSTDGGAHWFIVSNRFANHSISQIIVDPTVAAGEPSILYASVVPTGSANPDGVCGIWKSTDGGTTWFQLRLLERAPDPPLVITDMAYTLVTPPRGGPAQFYLFAASGNPRNSSNVETAYNGIWRSANGGVTWTELSGTEFPRCGRITLAANTSKFGVVVYAAFALNERGGGLYRVLRSLNNGASWTNITPKKKMQGVFGPQANYDLAMGVDPTNPKTVYLGGVRTLYSLDGGATWNQVDVSVPAAEQATNKRPHVDQHAYAFVGSTLINGNDGGVWKYVPGAGKALGTWTDLNTVALDTNQVYSVAARNGDTPVIIEGSQDNGGALYTEGDIDTWETFLGGDGGLVRFSQNGQMAFYVRNTGEAGGPYLYRAIVDEDMEWSNITVGMRDVSFPHNIVYAVGPGANPRLAVAGSNSIWDVVPTGSNTVPYKWYDAKFPEAFGKTTVTAMAFLNTTTLVVGFSDGTLYRTTDFTTTTPTWERLDNNLIQITPKLNPSWATAFPVTSIVPISTTNNFIVTLGGATANEKVFFIGTGKTEGRAVGVNWTLTGLPNVPVNTAAIGPDGSWYVGTDVGVYQLVLVGRSGIWKTFGTGLPNVKVTDLQVYKGPDGSFLLAATYGRGVYALDLPDVAKGNVAVEGTPQTLALGSIPDSNPAPSSITIDKGDGSPLDTTSGRATDNGTDYVVTGTDTYANTGNYTATATVVDGAQTIPLQATVEVADAPLTATAQNVSGASFTPLNDALVATFTDGNSLETSPDNFTAQIDWGDGESSEGTITYANGVFSVQGSHDYSTAGNFSITTFILDNGGSETSCTGTATIGGSIAATDQPITATLGTPLVNVPVATFTATDHGPFTATIDWGDGHQSSGVVSVNDSGGYTVSGSNTWTAAGDFPVTVQLFDNGVLQSVVTGTASVAAASLSGVGVPVVASQGVALSNVTLAHFSDSNLATNPNAFTATIDWGDGAGGADNSAQTDGTIVPEGPGAFAVTGGYTYLAPGNYPVIVSIDGPDGASSVVTTATVSRSAPQVASLSSVWGPPQGGVALTISGNNLQDASAVSFGGTPATAFQQNNDGTITAIAPPLAAGSYDVFVTTPGGTSSATTADLYTATTGAAPTITALSGNSGPTGGGGSITITGTALASASSVMFGTTPADFTVNSDSSITATVPPQAAGTQDVTITTAFGTSTTSTADQYTWNNTAPTITGLDSSIGPSGGNALLTISGTNLNTATSVNFGATSTTNFQVIDGNTLLVAIPTLGPATYDVTVTTPGGTSATSPADQYTAVAAPVVSSLSTGSGPTGGGTSVTITGSGFSSAEEVLFGDQPALSYTVNSDTSITAVSPDTLTAGAVDVSVTGPGGTSAVVPADQFTFTATVPSVSGLSASKGPTAGGTSVVITGANLNGATAVSFNGTAATDFTVDSPTQITATAPAGTGSGDILVTTPFGTSSSTPADVFTWSNAAAPVVSGLSSTSGPMAGGGSVTITGSGFATAQSVLFGNVAAPFTINSDSSITATVPSQAAATVDVTVGSPYGSSAPVYQDRYSYLAAAPSVTGLDTTSDTTAGGTTVNISGANLIGATQVLFGTQQAQFTINSDSSITATSPIAPAGTFDVTVVSPWGSSSASAADRFTFTAASGLPVVSGLGASSGPTGGGTTVNISGSGFTGATRVAFGSLTANSFIVNSDSSITAVAPAGTPSTVDVTVTGPQGISAVSAADQFTWTSAAPTVSSVSPNSSAAAGGALVTITGSNFDSSSVVNFGTTPASAVTVDSPTQITATVPALAAGSYHVTVSTGYGSSSTSSADLFTAVGAAVPSLTSLSVTSGTTAGGTSVVLSGSGFTGATSVMFGSVAATFTVNSDSQITATAPAQAAGAVDVSVTTAAGSVTLPSSYTYTAPVPVVTGLTTTSGPTSGGTAVAITGSGFTGAQSVLFGSTPADFFTVNSDTSITAYSPLSSAGTGDVTVWTAGGSSATSSADVFTATATPTTTPTVGGLSVSSGPSSGGTPVTITGTNLDGTLSVLFDGVAANSFAVVSPTTITAVAPPLPAGTVADVVVTTPLGISSITSSDQFTSQTALPTVTSVSPASGDTSGGNVVTLTGTNFVGTQTVTFGGVASPSFTVLSNTTMNVVVPVAAAGTVDVQVTNADGTSPVAPADQYTFNSTSSTPSVTGVSPSGGASGGGTTVTITGTRFVNVAAVAFGGVAAPSFTVNSPTTITATAPASVAGPVDVTVQTSAGVSSSGNADQFTFTAAAPVVSSIDTSSGPTAGGTVVTITGLNLNGATAVDFGSTAASFTIDSPTQITATAPALAAGAYHITVTTPYGTSTTSSADQFTFINAPTVTGLSVTSGSTAGGTSVNITGTNFTGLVSVSFGGVPAASVTLNSPTSITATTAAAAYPGVVDVTVTTSVATSAVSPADQFTYVAPTPAVSSLGASSGPLAGGTSVTVTGSGFTGADQVWFGDTQATSFTVNSDTSLTVTVPPGTAPGMVDVLVHTPTGGFSNAVTADQFTYVAAPLVTGVSPAAGPTGGGTSVIITGSGFTGASSVQFGTTSATFTVNSDTQITATAPAGSSGAADITVTTVGGTSAAGAADRFTWTAAPVAGGMSPSTDTASGGIVVTITGSHLSPVTSVMFGSVSAAFTVASDSSLLATVPAQSAGGVTVSVSSPGGTATVGTFTYTAASTNTWIGGSSGAWNVPGNWSSGVTPLSGDDVVIPTGDTVTFSSGTAIVHQINGGGALIVSGGNLTVQAASSLGNLTLSGGTLTCASAMIVANALNWTGGTLSGGGSLTIGSSATATLNDGGFGLTLGTLTVNNQGTTNWTNGGSLTFNAGAVWNNSSGSLFTEQSGSGTQQLTATGATINNSGVVRKSGSGTTTISGATFNNTGTVDTQAGTLVLANLTIGGTITVSSGATLKLSGATLASSASVSGAGAVEVAGISTLAGTVSASGGLTIDSGGYATAVGGTSITANVSNNGTLIVGAVGSPGIVRITGAYTQASGASMSLQIAAATAGAGYGQLQISGSASLAGSLTIGFIGGYSPPAGTTFRVLTFASSTGTFSSISSGGSSLTPDYNSGDFSLLALAAPPSASEPPEEDPVTPWWIEMSDIRDERESLGAVADQGFTPMAEVSPALDDSAAVALEEGLLLPVAILEVLLDAVL